MHYKIEPFLRRALGNCLTKHMPRIIMQSCTNSLKKRVVHLLKRGHLLAKIQYDYRFFLKEIAFGKKSQDSRSFQQAIDTTTNEDF